MTVSPWMPLHSLVDTLARAEWGPLSGAEWRSARTILHTLSRIAWEQKTSRSAAVLTTAGQISQRAAYSERWTRVTLQVLEEIGVLEWHRGGIIEGAPRPSVFKVIKSKLVELILCARLSHDAADERRRVATRIRLAQLRKLRIPPQYPKRSSPCGSEFDPPPLTGEDGSPSDLPSTITDSPHEKEDEMTSTQPAYVRYLARECHHSGASAGDPMTCPQCKYAAIMHAQDEAKQRLIQRQGPTPFEEYMMSTYPDATPREWARLSLKDPKARTLAKATA